MSNEEIYNLISSKVLVLFKQLDGKLYKATIEKDEVGMYPKVIGILDI